MSPLNVLYEDNHVIAVFKAPELLTQGDCTARPSLFSLTQAYLKNKYSKPGNVFLGLVHRLDYGASGVVVFGKTSKGASRLSEQIRKREVQKTYRALVCGALPYERAELRDFVAHRDARTWIVSRSDKDAQLATLDYRCISSHGNQHLLEIVLLTGRKHQIRAQLAHRGLFIIGDSLYGSTQPFHQGFALVSHEFSFSHPTTHRWLSVICPENLSRWAH